jgi:hypothetical protein
LIGVLKDLILPIFPDALDIVHEAFGALNEKLPQPYRDEITVCGTLFVYSFTASRAVANRHKAFD